jgi:hypothetical protein
MSSIASILNPRGTCYISVKEKREGESDEVVATEDDYGYEYSRFFSYFTADELRAYLEGAGMRVVFEAITTAGKTNWLVFVAQK